jgi:predicted DNA-binding transcriptional regulator AlpA
MSAPFPLPLPFLRTQEAARFIGVSTRTLEKHRMYGTGPKYSKVGGRIVYAVCDLREWVELGVKQSTSDSGRTTVLPAKPVDEVNLAEPVPGGEIAVEIEAAGPAKPVDEVNDPRSDGETAADVEAAWSALPGTLEAARFIGVSTRTLEKHRIYGTGPKYSKVGRRIVYAISDLKEWVERGAKRSTSDRGMATVLPAIPVDVNLVELARNRKRVIAVEDARSARPDTHEAARLLGLSHRTLERYRVSGTGPKYSKIGRRVFYAIGDLKEWAERRARRSTSDPGRTTILPTISVDKRAAKSDGGVR